MRIVTDHDWKILEATRKMGFQQMSPISYPRVSRQASAAVISTHSSEAYKSMQEKRHCLVSSCGTPGVLMKWAEQYDLWLMCERCQPC